MEEKEGPALDTRLLSDAIIELNISRRNVAIYPPGHASAVRSLDRAYEYLLKLFDFRPEVVVAIAKDVLVVDDAAMDKRNAVYREFALSLSDKNIACIAFRKGLTREELYSFHTLLADEKRSLTKENRDETVREYGLRHIALEPVDYSAFVVAEEGLSDEHEEKELWSRYVKGLLDGSLGEGSALDEVGRIPPEVLADLLNGQAVVTQSSSYDRVITAYLQKSSDKLFSGDDLKKLMSVIDGLKSGVKRQFLNSSVKTLSKEQPNVEKALADVSAEKVMGFLSNINEQDVFMPRSLRSLIERFSQLHPEGLKKLSFEEGVLADDFIVSQEVMKLLEEGRYEEHIPRSYQEELHSIMDYDASALHQAGREKYGRYWRDEQIEADYSQVIFEVLTADIPEEVAPEGDTRITGLLQDQLETFAARGQFDRVISTLDFLTSGSVASAAGPSVKSAVAYSESNEFLALLADSLRHAGRQHREEAAQLCRSYGARLVPALLDALGEEETQAGRRFLIGLLVDVGEAAAPAVKERLGDTRWFVVRNMLFLLGELGAAGKIQEVRRLCRHPDGRVRTEALRSLLKAGEKEGIEMLQDALRSEDEDRVEQAASLAALHKVRDVVPDIIDRLGGKARHKKDFELKTALVKALGKIGDRRALDPLRDIAASKSFFMKADLEKLKAQATAAMESLLLGNRQKGGGDGG